MTSFHAIRKLCWLLTAVAVIASAGCKKDTASGSAPPASAQASAGPVPSTEEAFMAKYYAPGAYPIPTGPRLAILPGEGVGPIRFGATPATVERLMEMPCEIREENACRYIGRAVEFFFKDGVVNEIRIYRLNRLTTPKPRIYGMFNGLFANTVNFGMYREAVAELIGKPQKVEPAVNPIDPNTVEVHHYENMRLEYDKLFNGNIVLSGVILLAPQKSGAPTAPASSVVDKPKKP